MLANRKTTGDSFAGAKYIYACGVYNDIHHYILFPLFLSPVGVRLCIGGTVDLKRPTPFDRADDRLAVVRHETRSSAKRCRRTVSAQGNTFLVNVRLLNLL
jgi:hypothetical protein